MRRLALALLVLILALLSLHSYQKYIRKPKPEAPTEVSARNVYVITASGLRAKHLSSYLYQPIQTPAIDFLAYDGVRFTNAFTPSTEALTAHLSLLTGIYPFHEPVRQTTDYLLDINKSGLPQNLSMLPDILTKKGYRTAAFLSDPELRLPSFFGNFFHQVFTGDQILYPWQTAYTSSTVCKLAREWIKQNRGTPHFLLLNFHEPTFPFEPPAPYNKQYTKYPYDGEIAGLDEQIGLFVDLLKETQLFTKSVIIFTSPYGETLEDASRYTSPTNTLLRVPLMVTAPGLLPRKENYETQVSLVDLMPTILALLEYDNDARIDGTSLFAKGQRVEVKRDFIFGAVPFARLLGFAPEYFTRNDEFLYVNAMDERATPHRSFRYDDAAKASWIQKGRQMLKREGIRTGPNLPDNIDTVPALLLEKVIELARQNQPEIALDLLHVFARQMPQTAYIETLTGMLASACKDHETALQSLRKAAELAPSLRTLPLLARAALAANRPEEAFSALKRYRALNQRMSYDVRSTYAITLQQLNRNEEALLEFDTVLRQNPRYAEAYLHRGRIWKKFGRLPDAEADFKMAIEVKWDYVPAYHELASLFHEHGKPSDAIPYIRQLLRFEPENYEAMLQLAQLHQKAGNRTEARKLLQDVILKSQQEEIKTTARKHLSAL